MSWCRSVVTGLGMLVVLGACRDVNDATPDSGPIVDAAPAADAIPSTHPGEVWVMAWNIQTFPKSASTVARVGQILEAVPADVVGVEEIDDAAAFEQLDALLPGYVGLVANDVFNDTRVGLLYRPSTVTIDGVETLFAGDTSAFPRPPLLVHVTSQGIDFHVIVLHLKALGDFDSEARRREAVLKLDTWLQARLTEAPLERYLLLGDWNDELTDGPDENVFAPMLANTDDYTFLTLPLAEMPGQSTYIPYASFIDHMMLTSNGLDVWGAGTTSVMRLDDADPQYESSISDHRPILTIFRP